MPPGFLYLYGAFSMTTKPNTPENNDFEITMKIPYFGEIHIKVNEKAWNTSTEFLKNRLLWAVLALASSGTIGAHILGRSIPPTPKLPGGEIPTQTK
jgi:hypothetical protein